jgi:uncharacterized protein
VGLQHPTRVGLGWRKALAGWIGSGPPEIECLEITAEHFFAAGTEETLAALGTRWPCYVHGLGLSLGTPGPLDPDLLKRFARVADLCDAQWVSEHVAFTRTQAVDLGHLNPIAPTRANVRVVADHARELADVCGRPVVLENIATHLSLTGEQSEPDFLNAICDAADCGLLLDVTNLYVNARNHDFDPIAWLEAVDGGRIRQLHVVGYGGGAVRLEDTHDRAIQSELYDLVRAAHAHGALEGVIIERDKRFPETEDLAQELRRLKGVVGAPNPSALAPTL